ncbi:DNA polymerase III subunit delta, partial [Mycoplasmopsis pullorum]
SEKKSISKEELQIVFDKVEYSSIEPDKLKILVIKNIENTSVNAINSILKQIEEPPKNTVILMSSLNLN